MTIPRTRSCRACNGYSASATAADAATAAADTATAAAATTGTPEPLLAEAERLRAILDRLGPMPAPAPITPENPSPRGGPPPESEAPTKRWIGDMMRQMQRNRRRALEYWITYYMCVCVGGGGR